jgi:hypothetical protein
VWPLSPPYRHFLCDLRHPGHYTMENDQRRF